jgi:RNA-directed DNA polymerase
MRKKFKEIKRKIKELINRNKNISAYQLIKILNPIIIGWAWYFSLNICAKTLSHLDNYIYRRLWVWLKKKYPKTSKVFLASKFFICPERKSPVDRKWHFFGKLNSITPNNIKRKNDLVFLKFALLINNIQCAAKLALPPKLRKESGYLKESEFIDFALKTRKLRTSLKTETDQIRLFNNQKGLCEYCGQFLEDFQLHEIHHVIPLKIGRKTRFTK